MTHTSFPSIFSIALAALLLLGSAQASAGQSTQRSANTPAISMISSPSASASPCFAWSIDWRAIMGNRRRMVQVALVALCIGIAILLKGKHG